MGVMLKYVKNVLITMTVIKHTHTPTTHSHTPTHPYDTPISVGGLLVRMHWSF